MTKKSFIYSLSIFALALFSACGSPEEKKEGPSKIRLEFKPVAGQKVNMNYQFSVNQVTSGDVTSFEMEMSGRGGIDANGLIVLDLMNEKISMIGSIGGTTVSGSASGPDSLTGDAKLVALPVFGLEGNTYRGVYDKFLNKKSEVRIADGSIVDSTENKMQFLIRYPENEVGVGDSWEKQIEIKAGNKMTCSAKYVLTELKGDSAVVSMDGKLYGEGEKFGNAFTMEGTLKGTIIVSIATGWPKFSDTHQEFILKMGGKDVPMKYDIKCKVE